MKFCTKCGEHIYDEDIFCTKCGSKIPQLEEQLETVKSSNNKEINNSDLEFVNKSNYDKILILKKFFNHKILITITALILCVVIIGFICLKHIPYKCFNIKDDKLIEILNDGGVYTTYSTLEMDLDDFATDVTMYKFISAGEQGILIFSHSFSNHIRCIMIVMDDAIYALSTMTLIASELDYSFYSNDIINSLLNNRVYSSNKYSMMIVNLSSDLSGVVLAPKEHLEYCVESLFAN